MSYIWTFSPECKSPLQRCLSAASPPDPSNKWVQHFGPRNLNLVNKTENTIIINDSPDIDDGVPVQENQDEDLSNAVEEFSDPDIDLFSKFQYFVKKCIKFPKLLSKLAQTLPTKTAEKLLQHTLNAKDLKDEFLDIFFRHYLPNYIKRDNSRFYSDVLYKSYKKYPQHLKVALRLILKDLGIQNNVVNDFILNLKPEDQTEILYTMSNIEFTPEEFSHNLFTIYTAYKSCNKTDIIQDYIFSCIKNYNDFCSNNKNFGKLLLAFLQQEHSLQRDIVSNNMNEILENHKSPFKRPCLSILKEIKEYD